MYRYHNIDSSKSRKHQGLSTRKQRQKSEKGQPAVVHVALQPERELDVSECQTISMTPVLDVTGLGTTVPEYASSRMAVWEQSSVTQPRTVSLS